MPLKPMLLDKKCFSEEKKHERYGSPVRQQDPSSHRGFLEFKQGSTQFQHVGPKTPVGGVAMNKFPNEPNHGYGSGSHDMTLTKNKRGNLIPGPSGITFRSPRDPRRRFWENVNNTSLHTPYKRPIDDMLAVAPPSHACSMNTLEKLHQEEQYCANKWSSFRKFYTRCMGKGMDKKANLGEAGAKGTEVTTKKRRLNWGEGLAKFEKEKSEGDGVSAVADTSTSVACSSLSGVGDKLPVKATSVDSVVGNLCASTGPRSQNDLQRLTLNSQRIDVNTLAGLSSSIAKLLESDYPNSEDYSSARCTAMTSLLIWKDVVLKVLDVTQTEICSLEKELKSLQSESEDGLPGHNLKSCDYPNDINSSGAAASKLVDSTRSGTSCEDGHGIQAKKCLVQVGGSYSFSLTEPKDRVNDHCSVSFYSCTDNTLHNRIISTNKEAAKNACAVFDKLLSQECGNISNGGSSVVHGDQIIKEKFAEKMWSARFKEKVLKYKYKAFDHLWKKDLCLRSLRQCLRTPLSNVKFGLQTISTGCRKRRSSINDCFPFPAGNQLSLVPTSEMITYTSQLLSESQNEVDRGILKMPALFLDEKDKMTSMFKSTNGLVEDPVAVEKERAMINPWTLEERKIFLEKFAAFGKEFRKIASFLDHKTTADCVEFYYKNHKPSCLEKNKKKKGGKSQKSKAKSGKKAPAMARGISGNIRTRSGRLLLWRSNDKKSKGDDIVPDERETIAAEALVNLRDSHAFMSSFITRSVDAVEAKRDKTYLEVRPQCQQPVTPEVTQNIVDGACSDKSCGEIDPPEWTDEEKAAFHQAVSTFGENFAIIAKRVGTKTGDQCKRFFIRSQKSPRLDLMHHRPECIGSLVNDVKSGRNDTGVVQGDSVIGNDKSGTKTNEDQPASAMNSNATKHVEARNLSTDLNDKANAMVKNTTVAADQQEKTTTQDGLNSISIEGYQAENPGFSLDHICEAARNVQRCPLKEPVRKLVNADTNCVSSATGLPPLSQKIEQNDDHYKTWLPHSSDSEETPTNIVLKLFGKVITIPSSAQKADLIAKGN